MPTSFKPSSHPSVSAYILASDARRVIDFAETVFGGKLLRMKERADGSILHAEVQIDDSVVMIADDTDDFPAVPAWLHVYVPDVDSTYRKALAAGGESVQEPGRRGEGEDRRAGVKDPAGNTWWIATK
jgi:PhnB protein